MASLLTAFIIAGLIYLAIEVLPTLAALARRAHHVGNDFAARRFYNPLRTRSVTFVRGRKAIAELAETPVLSQAAVYSDLFNFEAALETIQADEPRATRARLYGRVIGTMSPMQLPKLQPMIEQRLQQVFTEHIGKSPSGRSVLIVPLLKEIAARGMCISLFGPTLEADEGFLRALRQYTTDIVNTMKANTLLPRFLAPLFRKLVGKNDRERVKIVSVLKNIMTDPSKNWSEKPAVRAATIFGIMMDVTQSSEYWTHDRLAQSLVGIWFASSHQPWTQIFFLIQHLLQRPQYITKLRYEISQELKAEGRLDLIKPGALPLLDAFIKESVRIDPTDAWSVRRKALDDYTFSNDGPRIPKGAVVAVNVAEISNDAAVYPQPQDFCPERWLAKAGSEERASLVTDVAPDWLLWGFGSRQCPGRFLATSFMKMVIVWILRNYDIEQVTRPDRSSFYWETFKLPASSCRVHMRPRQELEG